ncbi:MAG: UDP-glucose 4-epimerase GalE [Bacteroidales bacterium]|nr:UDP-glucose 4-epimerase GalE [Bacteroidales bacterium]
MHKKVLVTGGTGYIGSHTVVELIQKGFSVVIADSLENSDITVLDGIEKITGVRPIFEKIDLSINYPTIELFKKYQGFSAVIHFAAYKAVGESVAEPLKYYRNNLNSLMNILEGMSVTNTPNLVFSSSCTVYGQPEKLPVTEQTPIQEANSPYGNTKQISEEVIRDFIHINEEINAVALRYFNPIGAHDSALIGELPIGIPNNLVPFITQTAAGLRESLSVFGDDYNTLDGSAIRDYIHVVDLAKAHVIAIERLADKINKSRIEYFNLGTGIGISVLECIKSFEKVSGKKLNYKIVGRRPGDIEKIWADTSFANRELNWKAEKTIDDAMLSAWNWEKNIRKIQQ